MMVEDNTTKAIEDPVNPLIINSILVKIVHFPPIQWEKDVAKVMRKTLNMMEKFINDMLLKLSHLQAPTIVKNNNETTNRNAIRDLDPTAVEDNDNNSVEHANTVFKTNNILGARVMEEKKELFY